MSISGTICALLFVIGIISDRDREINGKDFPHMFLFPLLFVGLLFFMRVASVIG